MQVYYLKAAYFTIINYWKYMYIYFLKLCYSYPFLVNSKGPGKLDMYEVEVLKFIFII